MPKTNARGRFVMSEPNGNTSLWWEAMWEALTSCDATMTEWTLEYGAKESDNPFSRYTETPPWDVTAFDAGDAMARVQRNHGTEVTMSGPVSVLNAQRRACVIGFVGWLFPRWRVDDDIARLGPTDAERLQGALCGLARCATEPRPQQLPLDLQRLLGLHSNLLERLWRKGLKLSNNYSPSRNSKLKATQQNKVEWDWTLMWPRYSHAYQLLRNADRAKDPMANIAPARAILTADGYDYGFPDFINESCWYNHASDLARDGDPSALFYLIGENRKNDVRDETTIDGTGGRELLTEHAFDQLLDAGNGTEELTPFRP